MTCRWCMQSKRPHLITSLGPLNVIITLSLASFHQLSWTLQRGRADQDIAGSKCHQGKTVCTLGYTHAQGRQLCLVLKTRLSALG